jgi:hypothetical protein
MAAVIALLISSSPPADAQESVTLSRYRLDKVVEVGQIGIATVELGKLEERCKDADGCEVTLSVGLTSPIDNSLRALASAKHTRLFLSSLGDSWITDTTSGVDNNGVNEPVLSVVANGQCVFSDAEDSPGNDSGLGFILKAYSGTGFDPWICTLTVID